MSQGRKVCILFPSMLKRKLLWMWSCVSTCLEQTEEDFLEMFFLLSSLMQTFCKTLGLFMLGEKSSKVWCCVVFHLCAQQYRLYLITCFISSCGFMVLTRKVHQNGGASLCRDKKQEPNAPRHNKLCPLTLQRSRSSEVCTLWLILYQGCKKLSCGTLRLVQGATHLEWDQHKGNNRSAWCLCRSAASQETISGYFC